MDQALVSFVRALRAAGADASPSETIDAAEALALVGYGDREALKCAFGLVLAKSPAEKELHDRVFDQFFAPPAPLGERAARARQVEGQNGQSGPPGQAEGHASPSASPAPGPANAGSEDTPSPGGMPQAAGAGGAPAGAMADPGIQPLLDLAAAADADDEARAMALPMALARAAQRAGVDDIRFASQRSYYTAKLLEALPIAPLDARLSALLLTPPAQRHAAADAELARLQAARARLQRAAGDWVMQRFELYGRGATESFMNQVVVERTLGRMAPPEMARIKQLVARMARKLAVRHSRRRRVMLRSQLDLRRTLRANAGHDSVPWNLRYRYRRKDKPRIVAVCDVSGSVASHVRFLLLFLYALHGTVTDLKSFAFSDRLQDVSDLMERLPFDDAIERILRELGHGSTDYGCAWQDLHDHHLDEIDGRTTLLVLGDARSNHANPRLDLLAELAERAKRVIWLNPEPPFRWGSGDSVMPRYRPFCTQVRHVASAADLERAIDDTLAAYG